MKKASQQNPPKDATRRRRGFETAAKLVAGQMRGPLEKRGFAEAKLITHWAQIMGQEVADMALPVKISHGTGFGGTLVLLTTGSNAPILEMQKDQIRDKVNACYGYRAVSRIQITQTAPTGFAQGQVAFAAKTKAKSEPDDETRVRAAEAAAPIQNVELKDALERLAQNILTKQKA